MAISKIHSNSSIRQIMEKELKKELRQKQAIAESGDEFANLPELDEEYY